MIPVNLFTKYIKSNVHHLQMVPLQFFVKPHHHFKFTGIEHRGIILNKGSKKNQPVGKGSSVRKNP